MSSRIKFFQEAIKNIKTLGTVTPSSRFLSKKMLSKIDFTTANVIVEFGPGNGAITKFILENLSPKAVLICFEINENFYQQLIALKHPQLIVIKASAERIKEELKKINIDKVDDISNEVLQNSYQVLEEEGTFIQYQYSLTYFKKLKKVYKASISLEFELFNFPPAFIYRCKKVE